MASAPRELARFLAPYPPEVRRTMREGRARLKARFPLATELLYDATSAVCVGFAYTGDVKGLFVNLAAYPGHVTLVFAWGVKLKDPRGLLRGEGKQVRHLRLAGSEDLGQPDVVALLGQAEANAPRPPAPLAPGRVVKVYAGPKRRPRPKA
jgi:hypothetical protein